MKALKPIESKRKRKLADFFVFDVETGEYKKGGIQFLLKGRPEAFIFGVVYGYYKGKPYQRIFKSLEEMKNDLQNNRLYYNKYMFGHNVVYDLNVIYGNPFTMDPGAIFNGSRFITGTNGNCKFADSMNVLGKVPLAKIGAMIGVAKPNLGDANLFAKDGLTPEVINRCTTDCQITHDALTMVFTKGGAIKLTGPSLAMFNFRKYYLEKPIYYNELVTDFFAGYYGGRTEAFKIGKGNWNVIDVNSMYPYIMKNIKFPEPSKLIKTKPKISYFINKILPYCEGQITCTVEHAPHYFGFLPHRTKEKLLFPVGTFKGTWCFPEIRLGVESGVISIKGIESVISAPPMPSPFVNYVDDYYKIKTDTTDEFEKDRVKHLLNDLYGKFGQRITTETVYIENVFEQANYLLKLRAEYPNGKLSFLRKDSDSAYYIFSREKEISIPHQIPSIAAYITSAARVHLLKEMISIKGVAYCDTDSIFYSNGDQFIDDTSLGGWKVEKKLVTEIRGPKNYDYIIGDIFKRRIKGVPSKAVQGDDQIWRYSNLVTPKEALRRGLLAGTLIDRTKFIKGIYDKRIVLSDGETIPYTI